MARVILVRGNLKFHRWGYPENDGQGRINTQPELPRCEALLEKRLSKIPENQIRKSDKTRKADSITEHSVNFVTLASQEVERVTRLYITAYKGRSKERGTKGVGRGRPFSFTSAQAGALDLHGYQAGHSCLEAVKDIASGESHKVVHEGCQGEDE